MAVTSLANASAKAAKGCKGAPRAAPSGFGARQDPGKGSLRARRGRFESYLAHMARDGAWGDHVTLQAAADVLGVRIHVVSDFLEEAYIEVTPEQQKSSKVLKLCFWAEVHYNSLEELKR
ncbi:unnamed protein product [Effrenium voratum]|nr:unnamed protein product [Effrenium voratum]